MAKNEQFILMMVDDDEDEFFLLQSAFVDANLTGKLIYWNDAIELLKKVEQKTFIVPDIILIDLNLPKKNGKEVIEKLRQNRNFDDTALLIYSTSTSPDDMRISYEIGANCFISKPNHYNDVIEILKSIVRFWIKK